MGKHKNSDLIKKQKHLAKKLAKLEKKIYERVSHDHSRSGSESFSSHVSRSRSRSPIVVARTPPGAPHNAPCGDRSCSIASPEHSVTHRSRSLSSAERSDDEISIQPTDELLQLLGADPSVPSSHPGLLHDELARRWSHIILKGLEKEPRLELVNKYPKPENCWLDAPAINPELNISLGKDQLSRDQYYAALQSRLGTGLAALGKCMTDILSNTLFAQMKDSVIPQLSDTARILLDLFHSMSMQRRAMITPLLSKSVKEVVKKEDPGRLLFGPDLGERLRTLQSLEKSAKDLVVSRIPSKAPTATQPSFPIHLNRKGPMGSSRGARQTRGETQGRYYTRHRNQDHQRAQTKLPNRFPRSQRQ